MVDEDEHLGAKKLQLNLCTFFVHLFMCFFYVQKLISTFFLQKPLAAGHFSITDSFCGIEGFLCTISVGLVLAHSNIQRTLDEEEVLSGLPKSESGSPFIKRQFGYKTLKKPDAAFVRKPKKRTLKVTSYFTTRGSIVLRSS